MNAWQPRCSGQEFWSLRFQRKQKLLERILRNESTYQWNCSLTTEYGRKVNRLSGEVPQERAKESRTLEVRAGTGVRRADKYRIYKSVEWLFAQVWRCLALCHIWWANLKLQIFRFHQDWALPSSPMTNVSLRQNLALIPLKHQDRTYGGRLFVTTWKVTHNNICRMPGFVRYWFFTYAPARPPCHTSRKTTVDDQTPKATHPLPNLGDCWVCVFSWTWKVERYGCKPATFYKVCITQNWQS